MAILIDYNQIFIANLMKQPEIHITGQVEEDLVRHMVLNNIRNYKNDFGQEYGQVVLCCDGRHVWRKDVFPYYKASRKKIKIHH